MVDGEEGGIFRGDRAMSRYEMAIIVSKTLDKYKKADPTQKAAIDKLSAEFASELNQLGARIAKVEAKTNTWVSGETRLRAMGDSPSANMPAKLSQADQFDFRQCIKFAGTINEDWSVQVKQQSELVKKRPKLKIRAGRFFIGDIHKVALLRNNNIFSCWMLDKCLIMRYTCANKTTYSCFRNYLGKDALK